jgi:hypothetical protein
VQRGPEHQALELGGERHGQDQRQRSALTADLSLEGSAARTAIYVRAYDAPRQESGLHRRQPLADLGARILPRPPPAHQRLTRLEDQRLDFLFAHPEHGGDFPVRVIPELKENERGALVGRQPVDVIQHLAEVLPALDLIRNALKGCSICRHGVGVEVAAGAELRHAAVASDRI